MGVVCCMGRGDCTSVGSAARTHVSLLTLLNVPKHAILCITLSVPVSGCRVDRCSVAFLIVCREVSCIGGIFLLMHRLGLYLITAS